MSEMVERVAIAINPLLFGKVGIKTMPFARDLAIAAIQAMREPTMAMMDRYLTLDPMDEERFYNPPAAKVAWQAMLDEALK